MTSSAFLSFLKSIGPKPLYVLDASIPKAKYVSINLSDTHIDAQKVDVASVEAFSAYIHTYLKQHNAKVAYGGYNEERSLYSRSAYFNASKTDRRTIHLGIDLWCDQGTEIFAPLNGVVHSFKNNINYGDYGPTIILQHDVLGTTFYTLYGHLSIDSLRDIAIGQKMLQGELIGTLGSAKVNGEYPPHLHFQIIHDLQGNYGDYPGVCSKSNRKFYLDNCPNPNVLLGLF